jgi:hypothetical protein
MRISFLIAALFRGLYEVIFLPCDEDALDVRDILRRIALENSDKEGVIRAAILSIRDGPRTDLASPRNDFYTSIAGAIRNFLSPGEFANFTTGLKEVSVKAYQAWDRIRRLKGHFEPLFSYAEIESGSWRPLDMPLVTENAPQGDISPSNICAMVIPPLYGFESDYGEPYPVTEGVALMDWQARAAEDEKRAMMALESAEKKPIAARKYSIQARRVSSSSNNGESPFLSKRVDGEGSKGG